MTFSQALDNMIEKNLAKKAVLAAATGSFPAIEAEFLIARWEAKADAVDEQAMRTEDAFRALICGMREKSRTYRQCVEDLRRHVASAMNRQPEMNHTNQ